MLDKVVGTLVRKGLGRAFGKFFVIPATVVAVAAGSAKAAREHQKLKEFEASEISPLEEEADK